MSGAAWKAGGDESSMERYLAAGDERTTATPRQRAASMLFWYAFDQSGLTRRNSRTSTGARAGDDSLAAPRQCLVEISGFQYSKKPPMCSLVSRYGPSVTENLAIGLRPSDFALLAALRPPAKTLAPAAVHLFVELVDIVGSLPRPR